MDDKATSLRARSSARGRGYRFVFVIGDGRATTGRVGERQLGEHVLELDAREHDLRFLRDDGVGQIQLRADLGYNEIWLVLHLPFSGMSPELERSVMAIEAALGHSLLRKRLRVHAR